MGARRPRWAALLGATGLLTGFAVVDAAPAGAATIVVSTTTDGGPGSLREAFATANVSGDTTIELEAGAEYVLTCAGGGDLDHTSASLLVVRGAGATIRQTCAGERVIDSSGGGNVNIDQTTIAGGTVAGQGGGVFVAGAAIIERSTIIGNQADGQGGGIALIGGGMITSTEISGNTSGGGGGGVFVPADLLVGGSTFTDNHAISGGGGGMLVGGDLHLQDSTVDHNSAGDAGGGVFNFQVASTTIINSTIASNTSNAPAGGIIVVGGLELTYSTVVDNGAPVASNIFYNQGQPVSLVASVIALPRSGPNCFYIAQMVTAYNFSDDDSCQLTDSTDLPSAGDPALGPLQDNGGRTQTMLPAAASGLIDRIPFSDASELCGTGSDQRLLPRPAGPACDIGAVERQPSDTPMPPSDPDTSTTTASLPDSTTRPRLTG